MLEKSYRYLLLVIFLAVFSAACGTSKLVRPLEKGEHRIQLAAAGPLTMPGNSSIPLPYPAVAYAYGLLDDLSLYGSVHPLLFVFYTAGFETGATYRFLKQEDFWLDLAADGRLFFVVNSETVLVFPSLGLIGSREYHRWLFYAGLDFMFHPYTSQAYLPFLYVPSLGVERKLWKRWSVALELQYASISTETEYQDIDDPTGVSPRAGVFMPFLRINYDF